jgi:hypothetical protein
MAVRHATVTLTGASVNLGTLMPDRSSAKFLSFQAGPANANPIYVGDRDTTITSSNFGFRIGVPAAGVPDAPSIIEFSQNSLSLSDFNVLGTLNEKLHILLIS